jgi:hypothetical protein
VVLRSANQYYYTYHHVSANATVPEGYMGSSGQNSNSSSNSSASNLDIDQSDARRDERSKRQRQHSKFSKYTSSLLIYVIVALRIYVS